MKSHSIFESDLNASVYATYCSLRQGAHPPTLQQVRLEAFNNPRELPYFYLIDVVRDGETIQFRFRLMGTKLTEILKQEGTGKFVHELPLGGWEKTLRETLLYGYQSGKPAIAMDVLKYSNGLEIRLEHMALPLSDDGKSISHLMGTIDFLGFSSDALAELGNEIAWPSIVSIDVPKRLVISNLAIPL